MFCGWMWGKDPVMRDPYAYYNEIVHGRAVRALPAVEIDVSRPMAQMDKRRLMKRQRVRSFEIACTLMAGELASRPPSLT